MGQVGQIVDGEEGVTRKGDAPIPNSTNGAI